jgi:4-amino-4-deoxy-L-arabinose transferase-like glycosyltransferase
MELLAAPSRGETSRRLTSGKGLALVLLLVAVVYLAFAVPLAMSRPPQGDEGRFANAAANFAHKGFLAVPMYEGVWLEGVERKLYSNMPLYFILLAGWFKLFGIGMVTMRLFSVLWGLIGIFAWYVIFRSIAKTPGLPVLGVVLVGLSYDYANLTTARYDPMCAALSTCALAAYLALRQKDLRLAAVASQTFAAAAILVHPYGVLSVGGVGLFALLLDWRRIRWQTVAIAVLPHVVLLGAWALYVLQEPRLFMVQFFGNAAGRSAGTNNPLLLLVNEIQERYIVLFAGWRPNVPVYMRLKLGLLVAFLAGLIGCIGTREIRSHKPYLALLLYTLSLFLFLAFLEGTRWYVYLIYVVPLYTALLAIWFSTLMNAGRVVRGVVVLVTAGIVLFSAATVWYRYRLNVHAEAFMPAVRYLQEHMRPGSLAFAPAEFGIELGFEEHVSPDQRLGLRTGRQAEFIVVDSIWAGRFDEFRTLEPKVYQHVQTMLRDSYSVVFRAGAGSSSYQIYRRKQG